MLNLNRQEKQLILVSMGIGIDKLENEQKIDPTQTRKETIEKCKKLYEKIKKEYYQV